MDKQMNVDLQTYDQHRPCTNILFRSPNRCKTNNQKQHRLVPIARALRKQNTLYILPHSPPTATNTKSVTYRHPLCSVNITKRTGDSGPDQTKKGIFWAPPIPDAVYIIHKMKIHHTTGRRIWTSFVFMYRLKLCGAERT